MKLDKVEVCTTENSKHQIFTSRKEVFIEEKQEEKDYSSILSISVSIVMMTIVSIIVFFMC